MLAISKCVHSIPTVDAGQEIKTAAILLDHAIVLFVCQIVVLCHDCAHQVLPVTMAGMPCQKKKKKKKEEEEKGKPDLTTVLHIRELPHLHMKLAVWFSFPTTNNKNPMIPS